MTEAKRGRPAIPEAERRQQIGVRTSPVLKSDLERAAGENGRSVAQEAELRLVESFEAERRAGSLETARLLRMLADQIAMIERTTGKRWHKDLATWAAVAEAAANGPIQQLRPDRTSDDEVTNEAWNRLWAIIMEKRESVDVLRSFGLYVPQQPQPADANAAGVLGRYVDKGRKALRHAIETAQISDDDRERLRIAHTNVVVLDEAEEAARAEYIEALRPFLEAEARGRDLFASTVAEETARHAVIGAARVVG